MEKRRVYLVFILLVCCIVSLLFLCLDKSRVLDTILNDVEKFSTLASVYDERKVEVSSVGYDIKDIELQGIDGDVICISEVVDSKPVTVFRFSTRQCNTCYESQLEIIGDINILEPSNLVMIVNNDTSIRQVELMNELHSIDARVYKLCDERLPIPIDSIGKPYYFRLGKDCKPMDIFMPNINFPELSIIYIRNVLMR